MGGGRRVVLRVWDIELFFQWINQHVRSKTFHGACDNAVKTHIWIAVSVYVLIAIVGMRFRLEAWLANLRQLISVTVFEKIEVKSALFDDTTLGPI